MISETPRPPLALVVCTQVLLGLLGVLGLGAIGLLPSLAASTATQLPEYADLRSPLLALSIAFVLLALIVLAMVSLLIHRIRTGAILTPSSTLWVDVIVGALACAVLLLITAFVTIGNAQAGSPFLALTLTAVCLTLILLACVTLALRSLLRHAISLRTELDEVV